MGPTVALAVKLGKWQTLPVSEDRKKHDRAGTDKVAGYRVGKREVKGKPASKAERDAGMSQDVPRGIIWRIFHGD